jgi:hypothetical protein
MSHVGDTGIELALYTHIFSGGEIGFLSNNFFQRYVRREVLPWAPPNEQGCDDVSDVPADPRIRAATRPVGSRYREPRRK